MEDYQLYFIYIMDHLVSIAKGMASKEAVSAIVGASIAGWCSFRATKKAHQYSLEKADTEDDKVTRQTLKLMLVEIQTAWAIYKTEYAPDIETLPPGVPHLLVFPIGENVFVIYDSAPSCMANLPSEISTTIVRLYMRMKGMVAMIKLNNEETLQAIKLGHEQLVGVAVPGGKVKDLEDTYVMHQARKMKMSTNADSIRALAAEIEVLHQQLISLSEAMGVTID